MAALTTQQIVEEGVIPVLTALDASNTFTNTGGEFIYYTNDSLVAKTITVTTVAPSPLNLPVWGEVVKSDATHILGAGQTLMMGTFSPLAYNSADSEVTFAITPYDPAAKDSAAILNIA